MIPLQITLNLDETPWTDLRSNCPQLGTIERIGRLPRGTQSGRSTVTVVVLMPDGSRHMAQTTLGLLVDAVAAIKTREAMEKAHDN